MDTLKLQKELGLGSRLTRLSEMIMKEIKKVYKHYHIDFDPYLFPVIKAILDHEQVTTKQITEQLLVTQPAITQAVTKLNKKGLVIIETDPNDKRKKLVSLSKDGRELIREMKPLWKSMEATVKQLTHFSSDSLIGHIDQLEQSLNQRSLSKQIIDMHQTKQLTDVQIIPFEPRYAKDFGRLNVEWLEKYFVVEPHDIDLLEGYQETILDNDGFIFFAKIGDEIAGCYALIKGPDDIYELGKMAVSPKFQGMKIGQKLMQHCIDFSRSQGWEKIILYSNTKLENAVYIYRKYGFEEIKLEKTSPYMRSNIKMELVL